MIWWWLWYPPSIKTYIISLIVVTWLYFYSLYQKEKTPMPQQIFCRIRFSSAHTFEKVRSNSSFALLIHYFLKWPKTTKKLPEVITDSQIFENKRIHFGGILRALNLQVRNRHNLLGTKNTLISELLRLI